MINQYRTLLLNESDLGSPDEYIAPNFNAIDLPSELQQFYNLLFPTGTSRYYAQFLVYCYLQILKAANQEKFVYSLDNRITYQLNNISDYFLVNQVSVPLISNSDFPIYIFGEYSINSSTNKNYDDFLISQLSTIYVSILSKVNGLYYNETGSSPILTPAFQVKISSNLMNNTSDTVPIANTGLSFAIAGSLIDLSDASGLTWEFTVQSPFNFNINNVFTNIMNNLPVVNAMLNFNPAVNDSMSLNLWNTHYNLIYRFAGLLNCYTLQVNNIL